MALYNRRLAAIARTRRRRGTWGRKNAGCSYLFGGFEPTRRTGGRVMAGLLAWLFLEIKEGWRAWLTAAPPAPAAAAAQTL